jgi:hypothetical protein
LRCRLCFRQRALRRPAAKATSRNSFSRLKGRLRFAPLGDG